MKKLTSTIILLAAFFAPTYIAAAATYTCSGGAGSLAPLTVDDPLNTNAIQVSTYIRNCINSGGVASGPSAQQLQGQTTVTQTPVTPAPQQPQPIVSPTNGKNPNVFCTGGSCTYIPLEPLPFLPNIYGPGQGSVGTWIGGSFKLLIGAGAVIAVAMIVLGALTYMFSDVVGNKKNALNRIRNAMWGVVILLASYLILYTINPELVSFNLKLVPSNNYNQTPNAAGGTLAGTPPTSAQLQQQNQLCAASGKAAKINPDNTLTCQ